MKFGDKAKDKVTGFEGIVMGHSSFATGCDQYLLSPPVDEAGKYNNARWFDVMRLEVLETNVVSFPPKVGSETG